MNQDYAEVLREHFPAVYREAEFVEASYRALNEFGFTADNAIAAVCLCRDEISQTLKSTVAQTWGEAFNLSSLGGMFFAGRTGLMAAMHHAPHGNGKERFVFYAFSHIAIDADGRLGVCKRKGIPESVACGALNAFRKEMAEGKLSVAMDHSDIEQSLLKMRLMREIHYGTVPDLLQLTLLTRQVIQTDLERELQAIVNMATSDYAVLTGVQIHGPDGNYAAPSSCYAVVDFIRQDLAFSGEPNTVGAASG
jgi:hypothetical protein